MFGFPPDSPHWPLPWSRRLHRNVEGAVRGRNIAEHGATDRTSALHDIARDIAVGYAAHPGARAGLLSGSVARGWADRWSDIELSVCWETVPSLEALTGLAKSLGVAGRRVYPLDPETRTLEEEFAWRGEKIDLAHIEVAGVDAILREVTVEGDPSSRKHAFVAGIRDAVALAGEEVVPAWRRQAADYPDALRREMIRRNLVFGPHWWPEMLADRNDLLPLHDILVRIGRALLGIVAALNRTYLPSDGFKWSHRVASGMAIAPERFAERLDQMFQLPPVDAVGEAGELIAGVFDLVAAHAPAVPIDEARARFRSPRVKASAGGA